MLLPGIHEIEVLTGLIIIRPIKHPEKKEEKILQKRFLQQMSLLMKRL
jgi:hypothetical protein